MNITIPYKDIKDITEIQADELKKKFNNPQYYPTEMDYAEYYKFIFMQPLKEEHNKELLWSIIIKNIKDKKII